MILRYIIFILIGFLVYYLIKRLLFPAPPQRRVKNTKKEEASEMVLDQQCGRYIMKSNALSLNKGGGMDMFFCSEKCLQDYRIKVGDR